MQPAPSLAFAKMADVGEVIADKYRLDALLGKGGMGAVFLATHMLTGKRFAIKMLLPSVASDEKIVQRFIQEARASARIAHRNVVEVFDVGEWSGTPYLVMELLRGESLSAYIARTGPMPLNVVMGLLGRILRGLDAAHQKGIIHRDLKPDNIFLCVDENGDPLEPKILDFGIAKVMDAGVTGGTATGTGMGTAFYMPLEQMMGAKGVTVASDIYSLAVVLFECLTGVLPYEAESMPALVMKIHAEKPQPLRQLRPELPAELEAILNRCFLTDPALRPQSVKELAALLEPFGFGHSNSPLPRAIASLLPAAGASAEAVESRATLKNSLVSETGPTVAVDGSSLRACLPTQPPPQPSKPKSKVALGASVVMCLTLGGALAIFRPRSGPVPANPPTASAALPAVEPSLGVSVPHVVVVRMAALQARVLTEGRELGLTPVEVELLGAPPGRVVEVVVGDAPPRSLRLTLVGSDTVRVVEGADERLLAVNSEHRAVLELPPKPQEASPVRARGGAGPKGSVASPGVPLVPTLAPR